MELPGQINRQNYNCAPFRRVYRHDSINNSTVNYYSRNFRFLNSKQPFCFMCLFIHKFSKLVKSGLFDSKLKINSFFNVSHIYFVPFLIITHLTISFT